MADGKPLKVPCPHCRRPALFSPANPWRPFCSERCRQRDLGAWANEEYRLPEATPQDGDAEEDGAAPRH